MLPQHPVAIDFETFYDELCNVKVQGNACYALTTDVSLVSVYDGGSIRYVGPLAEAPWEQMHGRVWISHNAAFDSAIFYANQNDKGLIPKGIKPCQWDCSADLCAYLGLGRKLSVAIPNAFGEPRDKTVRDRMKGKTLADLKPERTKEFVDYAFRDAIDCWNLWREFSGEWPEHERQFSRVLRKRANAGIMIDRALLDAYLEQLEDMRENARAQIPWGATGKPLALANVKEFCALQQIPPPPSLAEDSQGCAEWEERFGEEYPIIGALRRYRKANMYLRKCQSILNRLLPDGRMCFSLKFHGAGATGRLSGSDGLNMQNLPRAAYEGIDIRRLFIASPGHKFVISDFSQIEPRVLTWLSGNTSLLRALEAGHSLYEADARLAGIWSGPEGAFKKVRPDLYQLQKSQTLGIGYGLAKLRFIRVAKAELGIEFTDAQATLIIRNWHQRNPRVKIYWKRLEQEFMLALARGTDYEMKLPSGRTLRYFNPHWQDGKAVAATERNSSRLRPYWGASLFENVCQAIARDILVEKILALEAADIPVLFSAHDETICEVPSGFDADQITGIMCAPVTWAAGLPLAAESVGSQHYLKA